MKWTANSKQAKDSKISKLDALFKHAVETHDGDDELYNDWTSPNDEEDNECEFFNDD